MGSQTAGWAVMGLALAVVWGAILLFLHVPGLRPSQEALICDGQGGAWSSTENTCHRTDSPAAGLAS